MQTALPLKKMSRIEKLRAMEALWTDLSQNDSALKSPAWHESELIEAKQKIASGAACFSAWQVTKDRLRRKTARIS